MIEFGIAVAKWFVTLLGIAIGIGLAISIDTERDKKRNAETPPQS